MYALKYEDVMVLRAVEANKQAFLSRLARPAMVEKAVLPWEQFAEREHKAIEETVAHVPNTIIINGGQHDQV